METIYVDHWDFLRILSANDPTVRDALIARHGHPALNEEF